MKPPPTYQKLTLTEAELILRCVDLAILTLDHQTFLLMAMNLDRPDQINRLERGIRNLKKLRKKLSPKRERKGKP